MMTLRRRTPLHREQKHANLESLYNHCSKANQVIARRNPVKCDRLERGEASATWDGDQRPEGWFAELAALDNSDPS